ncbi:MAG: hypothetical protein R3E70_15555 [Burkholderiaceae bacterium]
MRKPILMLAQTIGLSMPSPSSTSVAGGTFIVMKPGSTTVLLAHVIVEDTEADIEAQAEQQVGDHVLDEDDRRSQAFEHLHLSVDQQTHDRLDVLVHGFMPPLNIAPTAAVLQREHAQRIDHAVLGDRVRILVRIRHARMSN